MTCSTPCDPDCEADCHEAHQPYWKRTHDPATCHIERGWWRCGDYFLHGPGDDLAFFLFDGATHAGTRLLLRSHAKQEWWHLWDAEERRNP